MKTSNLKTICLAAVAAICLTVNAQAQDKMSKMKKDTTKMSKMSHKKMGKMSKMKKDSSKM
jgi:cytochrome c556